MWTQWDQQLRINKYVHIFKSNRIFGTMDLKINQLQKSIEYQTNEQSTKYSNWNMEKQSC